MDRCPPGEISIEDFKVKWGIKDDHETNKKLLELIPIVSILVINNTQKNFSQNNNFFILIFDFYHILQNNGIRQITPYFALNV